MPQTSASDDFATGSDGFAGLLAALTAPKPSAWPEDPDDLQDDVATLSYERALHTHARYKPATGEPLKQPGADSLRTESEGKQDEGAAIRPIQSAQARPPHGSASAAKPDIEQSRKRASVTIRMSNAEFSQLQQRAAEAGLTVSAYLRSCAFEVDTLRAQVKQTLAELRTAQEPPKQVPRPRWNWVRPFRRATEESD